jgi:predicted NBD/HSP70 family sugar kinase
MDIDKALKDLRESQGEPAVDIDAGRERLRAAARRLRDDPVEARRIDELTKRIDRHEKDYRRGHQALRREDFGEAEHYLRRAAEHGNDEAAYWLAVILEMNSARQRLRRRPDKARELAAEARQWRLLAQESGLAEALDDARATELVPQLPVAAQPRGSRRRQDGARHREDDTGPPHQLASPGPEDRYAIGVELQPYRFTTVLVDGAGKIISRSAGDLSDMRPDAVVPALAAAAGEIVTSTLPHGLPAGQVALAVQLGSPVDTKTGTVHFYSKLPPSSVEPSEFKWEDFPLGPRLRQETGFQTVVLNDAVAFAERERWSGVGQQTGDFVVMLIREGVGGAVVSDGEHFKGAVEIGCFRYSSVSFEQNDADQFGVLELDGGITGVIKNACERTGWSIRDLETAAALADEDGPGRAASTAFLSAGVAVARGLSYLVQFASPTHVVLYAPEVMLRPDSRAGRAFLSQVKTFREAVAFKAYRNCELVLRPDDPGDGAQGAALAALSRCFHAVPAPAPVTAEAMR